MMCYGATTSHNSSGGGNTSWSASGGGGGGGSGWTTHTFPSNFTPQYVRENIRPDGNLSVVYGNSISDTGYVGKPHGHSVHEVDEFGSVMETVYSRTIGGRVVTDKK
jgi:hypothetical protein